MSHPRTLSLLLLLIGPAALLAGCGGGGGGGNGGPTQHAPSPVGVVTGKVVDLSGTPVPSGEVLIGDGVNPPVQEPTSISGGPGVIGGGTFGQGGYRLEGVSAGFHVITAQAANGATGSTQIFIYSNGYVASNANIVVSPPNQQATVSGQVNGSGGGLGGAEVFLRFPVAVSQSNPTGYASLIGYTFPDGSFKMYNVPVLNADGSARAYTAAAAYQIPSPSATDPVYDNAVQSNLTFTAGSTPTLPTFTVPVHSGGNAALMPTLNLVQLFTQPNIPSDTNAHARPAATIPAGRTAALYDGIRQRLSPAYAHLRAGGHAAAHVRRLVATPHATSSDYVIEADLFFSLPGDTATQPGAQRSEVYGFEIYNDTAGAAGTLAPFEFLQDPLANFYDDPSLGSGQVYAADQSYSFQVESEAANNASGGGLTPLGLSNTVTVSPLSFVNLTQPADPNDTNDVAQRLPATPTFQWNTTNPATNANDTRVAGYTVFLYGAFPGGSTGDAATSPAGINPTYTHSYSVAPMAGATQSFTLPAGVVQSGQEYWVVVAATTGSTAPAEAISVSQITPFFVQ